MFCKLTWENSILRLNGEAHRSVIAHSPRRHFLHAISYFLLEDDEGIGCRLAQPDLFPDKLMPSEMRESGDIDEIMGARESLANRSKREIDYAA